MREHEEGDTEIMQDARGVGDHGREGLYTPEDHRDERSLTPAPAISTSASPWDR